MDPKQQPNQPNQNSGADFPMPNIPQKGPLNSNQAADLIRHQLKAIYGQEPNTETQPAPAQTTSAHFNPFSAPAPQPSPQAAEQPAPQQQPVPPTQQTQAPPSTPYYNPYHNTNPQPVTAPQPTPTPQPGAAPGAQNYRNNYSSFMIPGSQPQAAPHTPQVTEQPTPVTQTPPATNSPVADPYADQVAVTGDLTNQVSMGELKDTVIKRVQKSNKKKAPSKWKPLFVSLMVGVLFLGANYNEIAVAQVKQYISPGDAINTPVIINPEESNNVSKEPRIIIPKINLDVPVVYDEPSYEEGKIQAALERGTVHYGNTPLPGEIGNSVILGHSSNNYFNSGEYKFAFVLLFRLEENDTFILNYEGTRYVYRVFSNRVVEPDDFSVIEPSNKPIVTLITCTPPGTSWKRLIIQAEQISPSPADAKLPANSGAQADQQQLPSTVPSNAPSLWSNIRDSIF